MNRIRAFKGILLCLSLLILVTASTATASIKVYIAPDGKQYDATKSTTSQGTVSNPLQRIEDAENLLKAKNDEQPINEDIEVRIEPGTYQLKYEGGDVHHTANIWKFYVPGKKLIFAPSDYTLGTSGYTNRPIFDGNEIRTSNGTLTNGTSGSWFTFSPDVSKLNADGGPAGLEFYYLKVINFSQTGVTINGGIKHVPTQLDSDSELETWTQPASGGANNNFFYGMYFDYMGTLYNGNDDSNGYSCITLQNASYSEITNTHCRHAENRTFSNSGDQRALIHFVYISHGSNHNTIYNNSIYSVSGDPYRVRDQSNYNYFHHNTSVLSGNGYAFNEWYRQFTPTTQYGGERLECSSHGNLFKYNTVGTSYPYNGQSELLDWWGLRATTLYPGQTYANTSEANYYQENTPNCYPGVTMPKRVTTAGNVRG